MDYSITFSDTAKPTFVVKPYTANGPKEPAAAIPLYGTAVSANTSLTILGKGAFDYGEPVQKNLVHMLENFANRTRPSYPIEGQLWFKTESLGDPFWPTDPSILGLYVYNGSTWKQILSEDTPMSSILDAGNNKIINVADAVNPQDALNLRTADTRYVNVGGDSLEGVLNMSTFRITNVGDPIDLFDAISQFYADNKYLHVSGGFMVGAINMSNHKIFNVADPVDPQDAVNLRTADLRYLPSTIDGGSY